MQKNTGIRRIVLAGGYSLAGIRAALRHEAAFRQEAALAVIMVIVALLMPVVVTQRVLLIASVVLVMIVELLNSAIEAVVDRIGSEHHELSGRAKDMGSAAVLISLLLTLYVWIEILWPVVTN